MKKLLFILPVLFFTLILNAQQTEDEVYVGKGKTFGNYKENGIIIPDFDRNTRGQSLTGMVTGVIARGDMDSLKGGRPGYLSFSLKKPDGTIVNIGTRDYGFLIPEGIVGHRITVQGIDAVSFGRRRRALPEKDQQDIQLVAMGILVIK